MCVCVCPSFTEYHVKIYCMCVHVLIRTDTATPPHSQTQLQLRDHSENYPPAPPSTSFSPHLGTSDHNHIKKDAHSNLEWHPPRSFRKNKNVFCKILQHCKPVFSHFFSVLSSLLLRNLIFSARADYLNYFTVKILLIFSCLNSISGLLPTAHGLCDFAGWLSVTAWLSVSCWPSQAQLRLLQIRKWGTLRATMIHIKAA